MTRFARAKGSKSSNLKSPEDSTPWEVMKEQLLKSKKETEDSKNREEAEKQRIENYGKFLKEQRTQKRKATWCDFPGASSQSIDLGSNQKDNITQTKSKKKKLNNEKDDKSIKSIQNVFSNTDVEVEHKLDKKIKTKKSNNVATEPNGHQVNNDTPEEKQTIQTNIKNKKKKKTKALFTEVEFETETTEPTIDSIKNNANQIVEDSVTQETTKKKKKKKKNKNLLSTLENRELISVKNEDNQIVQNSVTEKKKGKNKKNKKLQSKSTDVGNENPKINESTIIKQSDPVNKNAKSKKGDKKPRRKPMDDRSFQIIINGKEVQLIRFDGFPIMEKDAERLEELKKSMISKGIPKSEVQRTMKLERRRAEKALARIKRDVCYNCRKGGHNLSDCPDLKSRAPGLNSTEGICFKCGSTEHRQFECKVQRDKEFRFATCFICKESGHIARQCPDNPKGLYPNGGCCKLCGDVTHLRKDCPTVKDKKEESSIKLQTLNDNNIEDIGPQFKPATESVTKKPKKIKF